MDAGKLSVEGILRKELSKGKSSFLPGVPLAEGEAISAEIVEVTKLKAGMLARQPTGLKSLHS